VGSNDGVPDLQEKGDIWGRGLNLQPCGQTVSFMLSHGKYE